MDDEATDRAEEAVAHLRTAAHELIGAFRGLLDVAEELVDDPKATDAVMETVTGLVDAARRGVRAPGADRPADDRYEPIDLDD